MATVPGVATPEEYVGDTLAREQTSLWADAWRRLKRNRLALASAVFLVLLLVVAVISVFWTPYPIWRQGVASTYQTPNSHFLLGADQAGRAISRARARVRGGARVFGSPPKKVLPPPHLAQRAGPDHRPGHLRRSAGHSLRGLFELPRSRRPAAHPIMGCDGGRWLPCHPHRAAHRPRTGHRAVLDADGIQLPG